MEGYLLSDGYRGQAFLMPVDGGTRAYELRKVTENDRVANRYLTLLGSLLAFAGLFGFLVEYRLRKIIPG
jgi:hypothetical protein